MRAQTQEIAEMLDMLPEQERLLAYEMVKRIVLAWDPDFTRLTPSEAESLAEAEQSGYVDADEIDWTDLSKYAGGEAPLV